MTLYESKNLYLSKKFLKVAAADFYRDLFPKNSLEKELGYQEIYEKTNKGNVFLVYADDDKKMKRHIIFDDLNLKPFERYSTAFLSPISYFGRQRTSANARELFALTFDLDNVDAENLSSLFEYWIGKDRLPIPTYTVNSGNGIHLYYVFENPIPMYPYIQKELKQMKYELTAKIWNGDTSQLKDKQYQGINQGFRLVGGKTKNGDEVIAYKTGEKITLEILNNYVENSKITDLNYHSKMTLEQAKEKYPEWYEQRIVQGRKTANWICKRALYDWWKNKAPLAQEHHRYFYIMALSVYAIKCNIPYEELKKDAYEIMNKITLPQNPFTKDDVKSALEMYQECYRSFPRDEISKLTAIEIKPNKRNGRTRAENLKIARFIQDLDDPNKSWQGRKSVEKGVHEFLILYPNATSKEFCEQTGLSRAVFFKYKKTFSPLH